MDLERRVTRRDVLKGGLEVIGLAVAGKVTVTSLVDMFGKPLSPTPDSIVVNPAQTFGHPKPPDEPSIVSAFAPSPKAPSVSASHTSPDSRLGSAPESIEKFHAPQIVRHGDLNKPYVYLTVDDCWDPKNVEKVLKAANKAGIKITFLPIGKVIRANPGLYKEIVDSGHTIENHTYNHRALNAPGTSKEQIKGEILKAREALWKAVGQDIPQTFIRPPGGNGVFGYGNSAYKPLLDATSELGYKILMWDISSAGTSYGAYSATPRQVGKIESNVEGNMHNGGISLQHAINVDVAAFPYIIANLKSRGFVPITISSGIR